MPSGHVLAGRYDNPNCRTGPSGYIGWRNRFLGIDSWTFTNMGSGLVVVKRIPTARLRLQTADIGK
jgi:hypothetical protein